MAMWLLMFEFAGMCDYAFRSNKHICEFIQNFNLTFCSQRQPVQFSNSLLIDNNENDNMVKDTITLNN